MEKTYRKNIEYKKEIGVVNKISKLNKYFTSLGKLSLVLTLFFIVALMISGAGIIVEDGALNVSNNLLVNTDTLFVDSTANRVGVGTTSPGAKLEIVGGKAIIEGTGPSGGNNQNEIMQLGVNTGKQRFFSFQDGTNVQWRVNIQGDDTTRDISANPSYALALDSRSTGAGFSIYRWPSTSGGFKELLRLNQDVFHVKDTSGNSRLYVSQSSGHVGIGTTAPSGPLHVVKSDSGDPAVGRAGQFTNSDATGQDFGVSGVANGAGGVEHVGAQFVASGATTNKGVAAVATGSASTNYGGYFVASAGTDNYAGYFDASGGVSSFGIYVNRGNAYFADSVGIGTTSPARKLHISDAMRLQPIASPPSSPSSGDIYFDTSEALCVYVNGAWTKIAGAGACS